MEQEKEKVESQPSPEQPQAQPTSEVPPTTSEQTSKPLELTQENKDSSKYNFLFL